MAKTDITPPQLKELLTYDPLSWQFTRNRSDRNVHAGDIAGNINATNGYTYIGAFGYTYSAHRLVWLYVHGKWPDGEVDHINGRRSDNRLKNLRDVSKSGNMQNRFDGKGISGHRGVKKAKTAGRWIAEISLGKSRRQIGTFASIEDAYKAYLKAKTDLHIPVAI